MIKILIIAISLSMDAFSLSLIYGTLNIDKKKILLQSLIVGIYHFIMPNIGNCIGNNISNIITINSNLLVFIILIIIGIQMIIDTFKQKEINIKKMFSFGLAVSIDSFSIGITLKSISSNILLSTTIFMIVSLLFTYLGLTIGKNVNKKIGKISTILGGIILIIIGLLYVV